MSIVDSLKRVKKELIDHKHPFAQESVSFRKTYAIGFTMLVCGNGYPSEMAKAVLKKQLVALDLPTEFMKLAIQQAMNADDKTVHQVLNILREPEHKYVFMLDLYQFAQQDRTITEKEQEILVLFEELLQLNYAEIHFIRSFRLAMLRQDLEIAVKAVQAAFEQDVAVPLQPLAYFLPGFIYQERLSTMTLLNGQKRKLTYATLLEGEIIVSKGAELDLNGMEVTFGNEATIIVDGGLLKADNARFIASLDANKTMLSLRNIAKLTINEAFFDGANNVRAIEMSNTGAVLESCAFENCFAEERGGAVYFTNNENFTLRNCIFTHCASFGKGGSMYIAGTEATHMKSRNFFSFIGSSHIKKVNLVVDNCQFKDSNAEMSGALHIYEATLALKDTRFEDCQSRVGGAAVDTYKCSVTGTGNTFTACRAGLNEAVVVIGAAKEAVVLDDNFASFKECEPQNILEK